MPELSTYLKHHLDIPDTLISKISSFYQHEHFKKDQFLAKKGQYCQKLCFLKEGYFRFFSYSEKKTVTHWIFGKNQLVTDLTGFYLREPAKWNIQAITETSFQYITYDNYQKLREVLPQWDAYEKRLLIKLMSSLENRVYAFLSMSAEERYQYLFAAHREIFNELPLNYLASMLGMTPETLSRIRRKVNS